MRYATWGTLLGSITASFKFLLLLCTYLMQNYYNWNSCRPNVALRFDMPSFSFQLFAARKIPSYEQRCIDYCDILLPAAARQEQLAKKKIICMCSACKGDKYLQRRWIPNFSPKSSIQDTKQIQDLVKGFHTFRWLRSWPREEAFCSHRRWGSRGSPCIR